MTSIYSGGDEDPKPRKNKAAKSTPALDKSSVAKHLTRSSRLDPSYKEITAKPDYSSDEINEDGNQPQNGKKPNTLQRYCKFAKLKNRNRKRLIDSEAALEKEEKKDAIKKKPGSSMEQIDQFVKQAKEIEY